MGPERTRWALVLTIWAAGLGAAGQYGKISIVFDRMGDLFPGAGSWLGFTVSMVGVIGIVFGILSGAIVAAFGFRRSMVWALWIGAAMSALQALGLPFWLFLLTRGVEGLSHLALVVSAPTLIAHIAAERHRGAAMTLWGTFFGVAFAILAWGGLPLVSQFGVLSLFWAHALFMGALAIVLHRALHDISVPEREPFPKLGELPALHRTIYQSPWMSAPAAGWLFYTICFLSILTVLPPFIEPGLRAFVIGSMPLASIFVSMSLGVLLLRVMSAVQVVQLGFGLSAASMVWLWIVPGDPAACLALAGALGLVQGATFAAIPQLNLTALSRTYSQGALAQMGNLGNVIGTPLFVLLLATAGFSGLALVMVLTLLGGLAAHALLAHRRRRA